MSKLISVIVPCYNEEAVLADFAKSITSVRSTLSGRASMEIIYINDGSDDGTLQLLRDFHRSDSSVRYISFSRNFGKEAGIYAGLSAATGDYCVLLDADGQHPASFIADMFDILEKGTFDSVAMYRKNRRGEAPIRTFFSKLFFRFMNRLSDLELVDGATDYRMMTRKMTDAVLELKEYNRFSKGIFNWVGFNTKWLGYDNVSRIAGRSKWSGNRLLSYSLDGLFAFSTKPLTICFVLGLVFCVLALLYGGFIAIRTLLFGDPVAGFPSLFCMMLFLGGIQLLFLGIIGQYTSRAYLESKRRPLYLISETEEDLHSDDRPD